MYADASYGGSWCHAQRKGNTVGAGSLPSLKHAVSNIRQQGDGRAGRSRQGMVRDVAAHHDMKTLS